MKVKPRRAHLAATSVVLVVLGTAAAAWACSAGSILYSSAAYGPPGAEITVEGFDFEAVPVHIHWGSEAGPLLASASTRDFRLTAAIPANAPEGHYTIVAVARNSGGVTVDFQRVAFEVTYEERGESPDDPAPSSLIADGGRQPRNSITTQNVSAAAADPAPAESRVADTAVPAFSASADPAPEPSNESPARPGTRMRSGPSESTATGDLSGGLAASGGLQDAPSLYSGKGQSRPTPGVDAVAGVIVLGVGVFLTSLAAGAVLLHRRRVRTVATS